MAVSIRDVTERRLTTRVLIVEDDLALVELLDFVLQTEGYQVSVETDGGQVIEAVRRLQPDVITLDLGLPGMDGQEILDHLDADEELRQVPVVVISAFAHELRRTDQVVAVMGKPFDLQQLFDAVAGAVRPPGARRRPHGARRARQRR
ncbi:MAG: response regulator [Chloroflexi bacterium]|nr:response regulator [Chloroflexota bacterium]